MGIVEIVDTLVGMGIVEIVHTLVGMGIVALAAAVALPR